jgi:hypothetical protein
MLFLILPLKVKHSILFHSFIFAPDMVIYMLYIQVGRPLLFYYEYLILKWKTSSSKDSKVCELIGGGSKLQKLMEICEHGIIHHCMMRILHG